jgi:hypothetical protein
MAAASELKLLYARQAFVTRFSCNSPSDFSQVEAAIACKRLDAHSIVAVLGKTEGRSPLSLTEIS